MLHQKVVTFRVKELLHFASKVFTIFRVNVTFCVNCYILRHNTHYYHWDEVLLGICNDSLTKTQENTN